MLFQQSQTQHYQRGICFRETPADMTTRGIGPMPTVPNQAFWDQWGPETIISAVGNAIF